MSTVFKKANPETTGTMVGLAAAKGMVYGSLLFAVQGYFLHKSTPYWLLALPVLLVGGALVGAVVEWRKP
jgi:hypothetical protein